MGVSISAQTISITASALGGLIAGLLYDLLRTVRRGRSRAAGVICDLVFCVFCTGAMFLIGMAFCGGRPGFWEPFGFVSSFCLYLFGISPSIVPFFGTLWEKSGENIKKLDKIVK
jgi:MFS family permease